MQIFTCPACQAPLYFNNLTCGCGADVAFDPEAQAMVLDADTCAHRADIGCNWVAEDGPYCRSCVMTEVVPDLSLPDNLPLWSNTELAKRWMLANLGRWGWFSRADTGARPHFRLLSEETRTGETQVTMGHDAGEITINISEAGAATLAVRQEQMGELYRTMLGHMRHEIAHFLFERLAAGPSGETEFLPAFRALFGDEREDYAAALQQHYAAPQPADETHITSYATSHPHEDWAETIAHILHLTDLADSAAAAGLSLRDGAALPQRRGMFRRKAGAGAPPDAYAEADTEALLTRAIDLSIAVNHVNRTMDLPDLYPFVLPQGLHDKLTFAHQSVRELPA
ncbi:putative zinc-binding metallopeptidase [Pseudoroseicyclus sp. CXY001]|uniref:zinc-binding metallopeptidase family protein n=1 Tax=Pseudoroseicyclus sp. CXY001 TaxID=3242492 RepID=UPI00357172D7